MEQTALQELIFEWKKKKRTESFIYLPVIESFIADAKSKLPKEKEQIKMSFNCESGLEIYHEDDDEEFYNETFKSE